MEKYVLDLIMLKRFADELKVETPSKIPPNLEDIKDVSLKLAKNVLQAIFPDCLVRNNKKTFSIRLDSDIYRDIFMLEHKRRGIPAQFVPSDYIDEVILFDNHPVFTTEFYNIRRRHDTDEARYFVYIDKDRYATGPVFRDFITLEDDTRIHSFGISGEIIRAQQFQKICKRYHTESYSSVKAAIEEARSAYEEDRRQVIERTRVESRRNTSNDSHKLVDSHEQARFNEAIEQVRSLAQ